MGVQDDLRESMKEEVTAAAAYRQRAIYARLQEHDEESAKLLEDIAEEEEGHYTRFNNRRNEAMRKKEEESPMQRMPGRPMHRKMMGSMEGMGSKEHMEYRGSMEGMSNMGEIVEHFHKPFPQTDVDWENLGFDIEAKLPDIGTRYSIRDAVAIATGKREGNPEEAKRWLITKAGELGIG